MIKKSLYPKTKRVSNNNKPIVITEKLDGSNIGFFRLENELLIATRNNIIMLSEIEDVKAILYKGMYQWLKDNGEFLKESLLESSGFFAEWIGMGKLKYEDLDKRVYMFAKSNIDNEYNTYNIYYDRELFIYPFKDQTMPEFIDIVPVVEEMRKFPTISDLDLIYDVYKGQVKRDVEGFVVNERNKILKYVRMKNGKLESHRA